MLPYDDATSLSLLYHLNSEPWLNVEAYTDPAAEVRFADHGGPAVALPPVDGAGLLALFARRRSCRAYEPRALPAATIARLLAGAYGGAGTAPLPSGLLGLRRPVPSAGGLYPLELYAAIAGGDAIPAGFYHYHALHHRLESLAAGGPPAELAPRLLVPEYVEGAGVIILVAAVFERCLRKYGPRGYRYVLLEAGHVAQNLCLLAAEAGLGALCLGGFRDAALNRFAGLDGRAEAVVYGVAVGAPRGGRPG